MIALIEQGEKDKGGLQLECGVEELVKGDRNGEHEVCILGVGR